MFWVIWVTIWVIWVIQKSTFFDMDLCQSEALPESAVAWQNRIISEDNPPTHKDDEDDDVQNGALFSMHTRGAKISHQEINPACCKTRSILRRMQTQHFQHNSSYFLVFLFFVGFALAAIALAAFVTVPTLRGTMRFKEFACIFASLKDPRTSGDGHFSMPSYFDISCTNGHRMLPMMFGG